MSIRIMSAVWKFSSYRTEKLLVLLALADCANDSDAECFPSIPHIAEKARITERGASGIMQHFIKAGVVELVDAGGGRGHLRRYRIKGEAHAGFDFLKDEGGSNKRMKVEATKGEGGDIAIRKNHKEPSLNQPSKSLCADAHPKSKATRIPVDFQVTEKHRDWAQENGLPSPDLHIEAFRDYWLAKAGAAGLKADWDAALRTWMRKEKNWHGGNNGAGRPSESNARRAERESHEAINKAAENLRRRHGIGEVNGVDAGDGFKADAH